MLGLAWRFAERELRGGLKGFRILTACLALGSAAIAVSGSLRAGFDQALAEDARALLGGDLEVRQSYAPPDAEHMAALRKFGTVSVAAEMRANARNQSGSRLVELKGVDSLYPLVGDLRTEPPLSAEAAVEKRGDLWGAVVDPHLLDALGLKLGDAVQVGALNYQIRAVLRHEPDRVANALSFGPRMIVQAQSLSETGLIVPGSLIRWAVRLKLDPGRDVDAVKASLAQDFPNAAWHVRDVSEAAPGLGRLLDNLAAFLTLVGLTALLTGGIGVAGSVKAYLESRLDGFAVLKAVGAPHSLIFAVYAMVVGIMAVIGTLVGVAAGAAIAWAVAEFAGDSLPASIRGGIHLKPLALAAACGLLTALPFAVWPLGQAAAVPAAALFRRNVQPFAKRPAVWVILAAVSGAAALAATAIYAAERRDIAAIFITAAIAVSATFYGLARLTARLAAKASRSDRAAAPWLRLALTGLHRPGSTMMGLMMSLGLALTVLTALALVEGNLARQFGKTLPAQAPSFFFIDLQPGQETAFRAAIAQAAPQAKIETAPMVRGRIIHINGIAADASQVKPQAQWALRGDRGLTASAAPPKGAVLRQGAWWPADHAGPALVSVDEGLADGLGLKLGDKIGFNILGREIVAEIASLRQVDWGGLNMNFAFVLSPNALAGAPVVSLATVHAPAELDSAVEQAVVRDLPNVSAIRVKEALEQVRELIAAADAAVRLAAAVTLAAGALVVGGAVIAGRRRRLRDAVIMKVLGARQSVLLKAWAVEFGIVGLVAGAAAALFGSAAAWAILTQVMRADWTFLPGAAASAAAICTGAGLAAGLLGSRQALRAKAAAYLRDQ